jgi:hypothetical protein
VAQAVECLPTKSEGLSSNSSAKRKKIGRVDLELMEEMSTQTQDEFTRIRAIKYWNAGPLLILTEQLW